MKYLCVVIYVNWKFCLIVKGLCYEMKAYLVDFEFCNDFVRICTLLLYILLLSLI